MQIQRFKEWATEHQGAAIALTGATVVIGLGTISIPSAFAPPRSEAELAQVRERASKKFKEKSKQAADKTEQQHVREALEYETLLFELDTASLIVSAVAEKIPAKTHTMVLVTLNPQRWEQVPKHKRQEMLDDMATIWFNTSTNEKTTINFVRPDRSLIARQIRK